MIIVRDLNIVPNSFPASEPPSLDVAAFERQQNSAACFGGGPFVGLPRRNFRIGYIDPPWNFHAWSHRGEGKGACQYYPCQDLDTLKALPIGELMAPDAALFCWVVQPMLPEALEVLAAWGFSFRTVAFVWIKMPASWNEQQLPLRIRPRMGLGYHTRSGSEQCWLAIRGRGYKRQSMGIEQVVFAPVREHSRKPDEVANRIARLVGDVPRIELFARERRPGWTVWGNETGKFRSVSMNFRDELTPFANTGHEAYGLVDRFFLEIVTALQRDRRFTSVPRSEIELILANTRANAEERLFNELRDRVHLDDVEFVDGGAR